MIRTTVNSRKSQKYSPGIRLSLSRQSRRAARSFASILLAVGLTACFIPVPASLPKQSGKTASMENLVIQKDVCPTCYPNSRFSQAIQIGDVQGGPDPDLFTGKSFWSSTPRWVLEPGAEVPDEAFRDALAESLKHNGLLAEDVSQAHLILNAHLIELGEPNVSNMTAYSVIRYVLRDKQTGELVRDELFEAKFTVTYTITLSARSRGAIAVEGSIRENMKQFVVGLLTETESRTIKSSGSSSDRRGNRER